VAKTKEVKQRAPRHTPNLDEVIAVAIELLLKNGESDFRIEDVIEKTGISKSSLYLHFGDRDGLVGAAYAEVFTVDTNRNLETAIQAFSNIKTNEDLDAIVPLLVDGLVQTPIDSRWNRVDVLSSARYRPEFFARITEAQTRMNSALEELLRMQQDQGLVRRDIDAREMAVLIQAVSFGRLFRDIDSRMNKKDLTEWAKLTTEIYTMFRTVKN
jgi:AcrR family transcriptional regulator